MVLFNRRISRFTRVLHIVWYILPNPYKIETNRSFVSVNILFKKKAK